MFFAPLGGPSVRPTRDYFVFWISFSKFWNGGPSNPLAYVADTSAPQPATEKTAMPVPAPAGRDGAELRTHGLVPETL
jgi:hypothetical protein